MLQPNMVIEMSLLWFKNVGNVGNMICSKRYIIFGLSLTNCSINIVLAQLDLN